MPFIHSYVSAMRQIGSMRNGNCTARCRQIWMKNIKNALKSKKNPLQLNKTQRVSLKNAIKEIKGKRIASTTKKNT